MSIVQEKRTQNSIVHLSPSEKDFVRIHAAKTRMTISNFIRQAIAKELAQVEDHENPFYNAKNNT